MSELFTDYAIYIEKSRLHQSQLFFCKCFSLQGYYLFGWKTFVVYKIISWVWLQCQGAVYHIFLIPDYIPGVRSFLMVLFIRMVATPAPVVLVMAVLHSSELSPDGHKLDTIPTIRDKTVLPELRKCHQKSHKCTKLWKLIILPPPPSKGGVFHTNLVAQFCWTVG